MLVRCFARGAVGAMIASSVMLLGAEMDVRLSVGQHTTNVQPFHIRLLPGSASSKLVRLRAEGGSTIHQDLWRGQAGGGRVATLMFRVQYSDDAPDSSRPMHVMWADLVNHSDADTARRLSQDDRDEIRSGAVRVLLGTGEGSGFTFTAAQLKREKALWVAAYDVFVTLDEAPVSFAAYEHSIAGRANDRILSRIERQSEATYEEYAAKWSDMGSPTYVHPHQVPPGHIICLSWDSAIPKFGIDRGSGVWNDYGNPDHFRFWFGFGDLTQGIIHTWKGQHLEDGLPVITTDFEQDGVRYEVEQFAYPLDGPPKERRGDIGMLLMQQVRVTNLEGRARRIPVTFSHLRELPAYNEAQIYADRHGDTVLFRDRAYDRVLLAVSGISGEFDWNGVRDEEGKQKMKRVDGTIYLDLPANGSSRFVVKLPSPMVAAEDAEKLQAIDYQQARRQTLDFWSNYIARGSHF